MGMAVTNETSFTETGGGLDLPHAPWPRPPIARKHFLGLVHSQVGLSGTDTQQSSPKSVVLEGSSEEPLDLSGSIDRRAE